MELNQNVILPPLVLLRRATRIIISSGLSVELVCISHRSKFYFRSNLQPVAPNQLIRLDSILAS